MQAARSKTNQQPQAQRSSRSRMIAAINITFRRVRRDLRYANDGEIREERLAYLTDVLRLKHPLDSMRGLSDRQLGIVLDDLRRLEVQPKLPNSQATPAPKNEGAEIVHLASAEQVYAINKLFDFIGWTLDVRENFVNKRYQRKSPAMLTQKHAHKLFMILLNIAAQRAVRSRTGSSRITRLMIQNEIPDLKARLGIDRKATSVGEG